VPGEQSRGRFGEEEPGQRRDDYVELVGQQLSGGQHFQEAPWPPVRHDERQRSRLARTQPHEVNAPAARHRDMVRKLIERGFRGPPVEPAAPVLHQLTQVPRIGTRRPAVTAGPLGGEPGTVQPAAQILKDVIRHRDAKWLDRHPVILQYIVPASPAIIRETATTSARSHRCSGWISTPQH
jgi:hypothetical protein